MNIEVLPFNRPPRAMAAALPATVRATSSQDQGADVHLDGSASSDPDGDTLSYSWKDGATVIAQSAAADVLLAVGQHSIVLTVSDDRGGTNSTAPMNIEVLPFNRPPTAAAALPATVPATSRDGATVHLDGSASSDPDNDALSYSWSDGATTIAQGAVVDVLLPVGQHSIVLTVSDGKGGTSSTPPMSLEVLPRPLTITRVTPPRIPRFNITTMTVTGTGFNPGTKVDFSGTGITISDYVSIEEDKIVITLRTTTTTPLGNRDVIVTNPDGTSARLARGCYVAL
jgi:hypothetical protein